MKKIRMNVKKRMNLGRFFLAISILMVVMSIFSFFGVGAEASVEGIKCYIYPAFAFVFGSNLVLSSNGGDLYNLIGRSYRYSPISLAAFIMLVVILIIMFICAFANKKTNIVLGIGITLALVGIGVALNCVKGELANCLHDTLLSDEEVKSFISTYDLKIGLGYRLSYSFAFLSAAFWLLSLITIPRD